VGTWRPSRRCPELLDYVDRDAPVFQSCRVGSTPLASRLLRRGPTGPRRAPRHRPSESSRWWVIAKIATSEPGQVDHILTSRSTDCATRERRKRAHRSLSRGYDDLVGSDHCSGARPGRRRRARTGPVVSATQLASTPSSRSWSRHARRVRSSNSLTVSQPSSVVADRDLWLRVDPACESESAWHSLRWPGSRRQTQWRVSEYLLRRAAGVRMRPWMSSRSHWRPSS